MCISSRLIAAYHVLRRLLLPRHPPCALSSFFIQNNFFYSSSVIIFYLLFISHCPSIEHRHKKKLCMLLLRKEVIHPHLPVRIPCYDFTPITIHTLDAFPLAVGPAASGADNSRGVTGGVYKTRERIHRSIADLRLLAIPAS